MYYSEKTGIWERKVTPSSLSQCEQLPTNDDELGDNECVNLDDDEPFVVNDRAAAIYRDIRYIAIYFIYRDIFLGVSR